MSPRKLEPVEPGSHLPGWIVAQYDGRGESETPLWLPEQRALIFADALTAPAGELRVWATPWHLVRASPAGIARAVFTRRTEDGARVIINGRDAAVVAQAVGTLNNHLESNRALF